MPSRELFVILNPAAGRGGAERAWPRIQRALLASGMRHQLQRTRGSGHAADLAEQAAREWWPGVVAVGGDGVVHEVANGLLRAGPGPTTPLGVVAVGSGNDFAKMLQMPRRDPAAAVRRIVRAEPRTVDVGRVVACGGEGVPPVPWYFTNGIGLGLDAQVAAEAQRIRRLRGLAIYAWAVVRTLTALRTPRVRVEVDGREVADRALVLATLGNGACHGGSFWLCPDARIDDGLLDVLVADARTMPQLLRLLPALLRRTHVDRPGVAVHRGRRVRIDSEDELPIHADGEVVARGVRSLEAEVVTGRLRVLA